MAWNPDTYNKFKAERFAPFYDLLALINPRPHMTVIDLGCGTGELTGKLAEKLPGSTVLGVDSSPEMLGHSKDFSNEDITFKAGSIEKQLTRDTKWDLVFSHAAIQWIDSHDILLPKLISIINPGGQLAIQIPSNHDYPVHTILNAIAGEKPFEEALRGWKRMSPVLNTETYARILFENGGKEITVCEKIYPLILPNAHALFDWASGTAMIPYVGKLGGQLKEKFVSEYKRRLQNKFQSSPVFYPFKRIIMAATF